MYAFPPPVKASDFRTASKAASHTCTLDVKARDKTTDHKLSVCLAFIIPESELLNRGQKVTGIDIVLHLITSL